MLSERDLPLRAVGGEVFFDFLGPEDEAWLRVLIDEAIRFEGERWRALVERLGEPLPCAAPHFKRRAATRVLLRLWGRERIAGVSPPLARSTLFGGAAAARATVVELEAERATAAAGGPAAAAKAHSAAIWARAAAALGTTSEELAASLFADLPGERRVRAPDPPPTPATLARATNLAVAQAVLMRAARIELAVHGAVRPVVRLAKLQGLLCVAKIAAPETQPVLEISGPFAIFRHTLLYGRALAALLPPLAWCARYQLAADVRLWGRLHRVVIESGAPFPLGPAPPAFDSRLEERFARDFARVAPDWDLVREPEAVVAGDTLIFPDFLLYPRHLPGRRVLLEIVGFWTPAYVEQKLARLRAARLDHLVLCLDEERACDEAALPSHWPVVRFRRRIDAAAVRAAAERIAWGPPVRCDDPLPVDTS